MWNNQLLLKGSINLTVESQVSLDSSSSVHINIDYQIYTDKNAFNKSMNHHGGRPKYTVETRKLKEAVL
ncbi:hypothetical protein ACQP3L_38130, partial [Escherichia coli]